jgi:protein SCO1/2
MIASRAGIAALAWLSLLALPGPQPAAAPAGTPGATLPIYDADLGPHWPGDPAWTAPAAFPDFTLTDQSGHTLRRADLDGRIVLAGFFFTQCNGLCPRLRDNMKTVRNAFPGDTRLLLLSHSVTPQRDAVPLLAAYARSNGIDGRLWRLLTGNRATIEQLEYSAYHIPRPRGSATIHTELLILLDGRQRIRGVYNGTLRTQAQQLIGDIRSLEAEGD